MVTTICIWAQAEHVGLVETLTYIPNNTACTLHYMDVDLSFGYIFLVN